MRPSTPTTMSRSWSRRAGSPVIGSRCLRRSRLRIACAPRPISSSGRSQITQAAPTTTINTKTSAPAIAALVRFGSTATPVRIAGRASSGRASRVAKTTSADAVMPEAAAAEGTPARTSIEYCTAPTVASAARDDPPERVGGELREDHGPPSIGADGQPQDPPRAGEAAHLERDHRDEPERVDLVQLVERAEDPDQGGREQVEGDRRDREQQSAAGERTPRHGRRLRGGGVGRRWGDRRGRLRGLDRERAHVHVLAHQDLDRGCHRNRHDRAEDAE